MRGYRDQGIGAELASVGANLANLAEGVVAVTTDVLFGGTAAARHLAERVIWGPSRDDGRAQGPWAFETRCGCNTVRHYYRCECVPPCYGCRR